MMLHLFDSAIAESRLKTYKQLANTKGGKLDIERILAELKRERDRLNQAITALEGLSPRATPKRSAVPNPVTRRKKKRDRLTPEGRNRLSEMMKKRWAERRKKSSKRR